MRPAGTGGRIAAIAGGIIAVALLSLYLATATRDLVFGDSPELTGVAATLGVAHPPGYPIWTVMAHVFTLVPIDTMSFRVSAFSAIASTAAVVATYATAYRLTRSWVASGAAAILLGLTPVFWSWAIVPEVFALHALFASALTALLVDWHLAARPRSFVLAAFVGGLGLAHQQTIVLLGPAALWLMWIHRDAVRRDGLLWKGTLALIVGLLPYAYLPIAASRAPVWDYGDISSVRDLLAHVFRTDLGSGQLVSLRAFQGGSVVSRLAFYAASFNVATAAFIAAGALALYRRDRALLGSFAIGALLSGPAFVAYASVDLDAVPVLHTLLERFFILSHVFVAPVAAVGIVELADRSRSRAVEGVAATLGTAFAVVVAATNVGHIDQHANHDARLYAEDILATTQPGKILLASGDASIWPIEYLMTVEGARPDVTLLQTPLLTFDWYVRQMARAHPDLVFRAPRYDGAVGTSRDLIEPNGAERFEIQGGLLDDTLVANYFFIRRGLVEELRPRTVTPDVEAFAAENDRLLRAYRIPSATSVDGRYWDALALTDYALVAFDVGRAYESRGNVAAARAWYQRALAIDASYSSAKEALARLPKT